MADFADFEVGGVDESPEEVYELPEGDELEVAEVPLVPEVPLEAEEAPQILGDDEGGSDYPQAPQAFPDEEGEHDFYRPSERIDSEEDVREAAGFYGREAVSGLEAELGQADLHSMDIGMGLEHSDAIPVRAMISPLSMWEIEHDKQLAEKRAASADKHAEHLAETKDDLEKFYGERRDRLVAAAARNREAEVEFVRDRDQELEEGKEWESVMKCLTVSAGKLLQHGEKDTSRFRQILFHLKSSQS